MPSIFILFRLSKPTSPPDRTLPIPPPAPPLRRPSTALVSFLLLLLLLAAAPSVRAYSVLTHEQIVDLLWIDQLQPILLARFPLATEDQIHTAHAYAYGGCLIQDIGYYPFGNKFFSDLTHYVRSGDFVANLLSESEKSNDINQYAFALGALAHYESDLAGHPAVNRAVAQTFPKLRARFGPVVTYEDSHSAHIRTEFGFDVVQVARDRFTSQAFHDFIGFEVSRPLLERAVPATYGLSLDEAFPDFDLAVGTFRYSVARLVPNMTRVAIRMKKDEIVHEDPTMTRQRFLYHLSRSQYRRDFGTRYKGTSFGEEILAFLLRLLPKIGPLKTLDFKMPTPATENLYMQSVNDARDQYEQALQAAAAGSATQPLTLANRDFDTGLPTRAGEYALTDSTYADLLIKLAHNNFAQLTPALQSNILTFYRDSPPPAFAAKNPRRWKEIGGYLAQLQTLTPAIPPAAGIQ